MNTQHSAPESAPWQVFTATLHNLLVFVLPNGHCLALRCCKLTHTRLMHLRGKLCLVSSHGHVTLSYRVPFHVGEPSKEMWMLSLKALVDGDIMNTNTVGLCHTAHVFSATADAHEHTVYHKLIILIGWVCSVARFLHFLIRGLSSGQRGMLLWNWRMCRISVVMNYKTI